MRTSKEKKLIELIMKKAEKMAKRVGVRTNRRGRAEDIR